MTTSCINTSSINEFNNSTPDNKTITARILSNYIDSVKKKEAHKNIFLKFVQFVKKQFTKLLFFINLKWAELESTIFNNIQKLRSHFLQREVIYGVGLNIFKNLRKISVDQNWSNITEYIERNSNDVLGGLCHGFTTTLGMILLNKSGDQNPTKLTYKDFLFCLDILTGNQNYEPDNLSDEDKTKIKTIFEMVLIYQQPKITGLKEQNIFLMTKELKEETYSLDHDVLIYKKEAFINHFLKLIDKKITKHPGPAFINVQGKVLFGGHSCMVGFLDKKTAVFYDYALGFYNCNAPNKKLRLIREFNLNNKEEMKQMAEAVFNTFSSHLVLLNRKAIFSFAHTNVASDCTQQLEKVDPQEMLILKINEMLQNWLDSMYPSR